MFRVYMLLFLLLHPSYLFSFSLPGRQGMFVTGADISKGGDYLAVVGYGDGSCSGTGDGMVIYKREIIKPDSILVECGLYYRSSAEAIAIYSENPLRVVITAEGYDRSFLCDVDYDNRDVSCKMFSTPDFSSGRMAEVSGIDFDSRGRMYSIADNGQYIFRYKSRCAERGLCKRDKEIRLPRYYNQMEGLSIDRCYYDPSAECIYAADIGTGGGNEVLVYNLKTKKFTYKRFQKRKNTDSEALATIFDTTGLNIFVIHKDNEGTVERRKY